MGNPRGFLQIGRAKGSAKSVSERLTSYREFDIPLPEADLRAQASRCMDCGIPFCHKGCPLGNLIPEWNDHVYRGRYGDAVAALEATNNFPEMTGRVCPAPCESSCVLNIDGAPVTIKDVERFLGDRMNGPSMALVPKPPRVRIRQRVAIIGSGPAGLAAAQQLGRAGYEVTVMERSDRLGGLLRYGIPDFKMEKAMIDRRIEQMRSEGVVFRTGVEVGVTLMARELREKYDAVLLAVGACQARELTVTGRDLAGVHLAMDYLTQQNRRVAGDVVPDAGAILANGKHVVILGGGDTGSDCLGTALRQGAASVTQLELMPAPPKERMPENPWPEWPVVYRTSSSQEEGGARDFAVQTKRVLGDERGRVRALAAVRLAREGGKLVEVPGSTFEIPCDLLLLAMGFTGPERSPLLADLGVALDARGNVAVQGCATSVPSVFAAGDVSRGASLVVWAIAEGRKAAAAIDAYLSERRQHPDAAELAGRRSRIFPRGHRDRVGWPTRGGRQPPRVERRHGLAPSAVRGCANRLAVELALTGMTTHTRTKLAKSLSLVAMALVTALAPGCGGDGGSGDGNGAVEQGPLSSAERDGLTFTREEEKLARDTYAALGAIDPVFANIGASEQTHMDAVGTLLARYGVDDPAAGKASGRFESPVLQSLYDSLVAKGSGGAAVAFEVGVEIEELDIRDIERLKQSSAHTDLDKVFDNLTRGSRNHLRSFQAKLLAAGGSYAPKYLDAATFQGIVSSPMETGP